MAASAWKDENDNRWVFIKEACGYEPIYLVYNNENIADTARWSLRIDDEDNLIVAIRDFDYPLRFDLDEMTINPDTEAEKKLIRIE